MKFFRRSEKLFHHQLIYSYNTERLLLVQVDFIHQETYGCEWLCSGGVGPVRTSTLFLNH